MKLEESRVLLTGAAGGIGAAIASELAASGARLLLVDRNAPALDALQRQLAKQSTALEAVAVDLTEPSARGYLAGIARKWQGGIDILINNAGIADFALLPDQSEARIEQILQLNVLAPILLTRALLPWLETRPQACVLNVGSILGHIGHPGLAVYGASKAAVATFSEALRREYAKGSVRVLCVEPRATRTPLNSDAVNRMNEALGVASDPPELVAKAVIDAIRRDRASTLLGWPEKLFVRINALLPGLVDRNFRGKLDIVRQFAAPQNQGS
jgi:short-subunit dehydrogenase